MTTKGDRQYHGFGLRSMRYLVKKYDGCLTVGTGAGCFFFKDIDPDSLHLGHIFDHLGYNY